MAKFDADSDDKCFVHVATHGGEVMKVTGVRDGIVPRYDLVTIKGVNYRNVGEYELTPATKEEVIAILRRVE